MTLPPFSLPRALSMPFQASSLILVTLTSALLLLFGAFQPQVSIPSWLGTYIMCVWANRFAFALLDSAANGDTRTPVASVEMLGPFTDARSWVLPALASFAALGIAMLPAGSQLPAALAAFLLLPIPVAATEISDRIVDAINPAAWWRLVRGLGGTYPALLLALAGGAAVGWLTWRLPLPRLVQFAVTQLLYFSAFALLGGVIHLRRNALDFTPRHSAERTREKQDTAHASALQAMIDDSFKSLRARRLEDLAATLARWLGQTPVARRAADCAAVMQAADHWSDHTGQKLLRRVLVERLAALPDPSLALRFAEEALRSQPDFSPTSVELTCALVRYARQTGRKRLAAQLLANALERCPPAERAALDALQEDARA